MEEISATLRVVIPIYLMIAVGYLAKRNRIFSGGTLKEINVGVFRVFLPMLLFENMYTTRIDRVDISVVVFALCSVLLIFGICCLLVFRVIKEKSIAATIVQGMYRSNFALLGIALTQMMYGINGTQTTGMLVAVIIPLYNVLAVILFEVTCGKKKTDVLGILVGIIKNPLIIGTVAGLVFNLCEISIPDAVDATIISFGQVATPLSLIVMGGSFEVSKALSNKMALFLVSIVRLLAIPVVGTIVAVLFGYRQEELYGLFLMYATPTAVSSYAMAAVMGGDEGLAGEIVMLTTVISMFTLGIGVYVLTRFGIV